MDIHAPFTPDLTDPHVELLPDGRSRHAVRASELFNVPLGQVSLWQYCQARARNWHEDSARAPRKPKPKPQPRFYSPDECRRKADQHWDMAGLAHRDGDSKDAARHTALARVWEQRRVDGGWSGNNR